jgi:hypothetical protein
MSERCGYCGQAEESEAHHTWSEDIEIRVAAHEFVPPDVTELSMALAVKLASLVVHAEEAAGPTGHSFDVEAMRSTIADPEVQSWIERFDPALLPVKR